MKIIEYTDDGKIIGVVTTPPEFAELYTDPEPLKLFIEHDSVEVKIETHYVDQDQQVQARAKQPTTLAGLTLTGIPVPAVLTTRGPIRNEVEVTDPDVTLDFDLPGTYRLLIEPEDPQWLPWEAEVTV